MVFVNYLFVLLGMFYFINSYADLIVSPGIEPGSNAFISNNVTVLLITVVIGIIILLLVAYYIRKK